MSRLGSIKERLAAIGEDMLYDYLVGWQDFQLNERYRLRGLWAVGGQSALFQVDDGLHPSLPLLARVPLLRYDRPAYISELEIQESRRLLRHEASVLTRFRDSTLPTLHELVEAPNPLLPDQWGALRASELYLLMEHLDGSSLKEILPALHGPGGSPDVREALCWDVARTVVELFQQLAAAGFLYVDVNPTNVCVTRDPAARIRIFDAGSIIPRASDPEFTVPYTPAYVPPTYLEALESGDQKWPDESVVAYALGVTLWQVLTNRQPFPARVPDWSDPRFSASSPAIRGFIEDLTVGAYCDFQTTAHALADVARESCRSGGGASA